jgi:predicted acylesterase/phospholipase RssA
MRSLSRARVPAFALLALAAAVGCSSGPPVVNPPRELLGRSWYNAHQPTPDTYPSPDQTVVSGLDAAFGHNPTPTPPPAQTETRPLSVLALSGGGKYGAFVAGFMNGWTASGNRPTFDVVTGISSGAIAAPYAFIGPHYDERMARNFTTVRRRDVFRFRPVTGPHATGSLGSSKPFEERIREEVDETMLAEIRQAHCQGRRLFVATGNRVTFRPAIWDLGAIASSGRPDASELVRKILLASASHPGVTPGVEFDVTVNGVHYKELHQDGGNIIQTFVQTGNGLPPGSDVFVVTAGKLFRDPVDRRPSVFGTVTAAASNSLYALFRADVMAIYALCAVTRSRFHLIDLPDNVMVTAGSLSFDPEDLQKLYDAGYQAAASGPRWMTTPPASQPGETVVPRAGLDYVVP